MQIGLLTDGLEDWSLPEIFDWLPGAAPTVRSLEIATGGYSSAAHCDRRKLLSHEPLARAPHAAIVDRGLEIAAFNVSGNPLHPDTEIATQHDRALRETLELAALVGVRRVVALSGCPGPGPGTVRAPYYIAGARRRDLEQVLDWQWEERIIPYWASLTAEAREISADLRICLELSPSAAVYNLQTFERLSASVAGLAVNLDPSHLFSQEFDPLLVMAHLRGRVAFAHGKDTLIQNPQRALNGVLDARWPEDPRERPWVFSTPGDVHDVSWWTEFVRARAASGHDGTISIGYEDPYRSPVESIAVAAHTLTAAIEASGGEDPVTIAP